MRPVSPSDPHSPDVSRTPFDGCWSRARTRTHAHGVDRRVSLRQIAAVATPRVRGQRIASVGLARLELCIELIAPLVELSKCFGGASPRQPLRPLFGGWVRVAGSSLRSQRAPATGMTPRGPTPAGPREARRGRLRPAPVLRLQRVCFVMRLGHGCCTGAGVAGVPPARPSSSRIKGRMGHTSGSAGGVVIGGPRRPVVDEWRTPPAPSAYPPSGLNTRAARAPWGLAGLGEGGPLTGAWCSQSGALPRD